MFVDDGGVNENGWGERGTKEVYVKHSRPVLQKIAVLPGYSG